MRSGNDKASEATRLLSAEVWHMDVRHQQAIPHDGKTTQSWTGRSWYCLRET